MNKNLWIIGLLMLMSIGFASAFSGSGTGTDSDPYQITIFSQLGEIGGDMSAHYILMNDIDGSVDALGGLYFFPTLGVGAELVPFTGELDGNKHLLMNFHMYSGGFFYTLGSGGYIHDLGVTNIYNEEPSDGSPCGDALLTELNGGTIENVYITGITSADYGASSGLICTMNSGSIINTYSIVQAIDGVSCSMMGGCPKAGLVLTYNGGTITNSYWNTDIVPTSAGGTGLTTAEMKTQSVYMGWNFNSVWQITTANSGYPSFRSPSSNICGLVTKTSTNNNTFIFENDCLTMTVPKNYNKNAITMYNKVTAETFKVFFDSAYEKDKGTKEVKVVKDLFNNLGFSSSDDNSVSFTNGQVTISYVLSDDRVKVNGVVSDYVFDYPNSHLWLKYGYKGKGRISFPPLTVSGVWQNSVVEYKEEMENGVSNKYAYELLNDTTFTLFDPIFLPEDAPARGFVSGSSGSKEVVVPQSALPTGSTAVSQPSFLSNVWAGFVAWVRSWWY